MQKVITLPVVLLLFNFIVRAQPIISFGAKAGANFSTFMGEVEGSEALIGPHVGGLVSFAGTNDEGFLKNVFQAEVLYSMQGAKSGDDKTTLSYINVPVMIQRYIKSTGLYFETGPQVGFLISAKDKVNGDETDVKSQLKGFDFSLNFGLGYRFNSGFGLGARYSLGVTPVNKSGYDAHNAVISGGIFYIFGSNDSSY